jgi:hypothetical protein
MSEAAAAVVATITAPPPAPKAGSTPASAANPPATEVATPAQPPAQEPPKTDASTEALERKAEALAKAKRESARIQAQREKLKQEQLAHQDALKESAELRRLDALKKSDPLAFLKEIGLEMPALSRKYLEAQTGAGKTPEQIAQEVYEKNRAAEAKIREAEAQKAGEAQAIADREAAYAGARRTLSEMIKADPVAFEVCGLVGDEAVTKAFGLIETYHRETGQVLDFRKALAAAEAHYEARELTVASKSKKVATGLEKLRVQAAEAVKKLAEAEKSNKGVPKVEARKSVEPETKAPPTQPLTKRLMPRDQKRIAKELALAHLAKQDS